MDDLSLNSAGFRIMEWKYLPTPHLPHWSVSMVCIHQLAIPISLNPSVIVTPSPLEGQCHCCRAWLLNILPSADLNPLSMQLPPMGLILFSGATQSFRPLNMHILGNWRQWSGTPSLLSLAAGGQVFSVKVGGAGRYSACLIPDQLFSFNLI